jgi:segregation and condensation protein A
MRQFRLPEFEGPLDLLLHLIEHRELDITRVSLAAVADQYLEMISTPGAIELAALADYLVIAAKLILIKSRLLLPRPEGPAPEGEEDVGEALARQLREYKMFKQVAAFLRERERQGLRAYPRLAPPPRPAPTAWRLEGASADDLAQALQRALRIRPTMPQGTLTVPLAVSIDEKIQNLITLTMQHVRVRFNQLLESATTRVEIIVTFLAVLELIKRGQLVAQQDRLFGEIILAQRNETRSVVESARADTDYTTDRENL